MLLNNQISYRRMPRSGLQPWGRYVFSCIAWERFVMRFVEVSKKCDDIGYAPAAARQQCAQFRWRRIREFCREMLGSNASRSRD
jgi:hypothetical protein